MSNHPKNDRYTDVDKEALRLDYVFEKGINFKDRIIQITGEITDQHSFDYLDAALTEMERDSKKSVTIRLNSPGGSVYEALAMVGRLQSSKCHVVTECYGHAMSAAGLILAAGDRRRMSKYSWWMAHEFQYGMHGSHSEMILTVKQAAREMEHWAEAMASFTTQPKEFWIKAAKNTELYLSAEECFDYGVVDEII